MEQGQQEWRFAVGLGNVLEAGLWQPVKKIIIVIINAERSGKDGKPLFAPGCTSESSGDLVSLPSPSAQATPRTNEV